MNTNKLLTSLPYVKEGVTLSEHCWFRVGGKADYFAELSNKEKSIEAVQILRESKMPFFVLGSGSNVVFHDKGFRGLVIKIKTQNIEIQENKIVACAGADLKTLMEAAAESNLAGWEGLYGIPGTVGGAIRGNVGAYGNEIKDFIRKVTFLTFEGMEKTISHRECDFRYRHSIFKEKETIICSAEFQLHEVNGKAAFDKMKKIMSTRRKKHPSKFTAGCFFKNPKIKNVSAAELIEKSGMKGKKIGNAQVSPKHANFIVNLGNATASDILELSEKVKDAVRRETGVLLEPEVQIVPENPFANLNH